MSHYGECSKQFPLAIPFVFLALTSCIGGGFKTDSSADSNPADKVRVTLEVTGPGALNALDGSVCQNNCVIELEKNSETEFQADWDPSNGLQLASFSGCDLLESSGTICHLTPSSDTTISAVFSKPPIADMIFSDQGTILYLSMFDANQQALTFDPDGTIVTSVLSASNGGTIVCAAGGDPAQTAVNSNCFSDPNYLFVLDNIDPNLTSLNIQFSITDDAGLATTITEPIR